MCTLSQFWAHQSLTTHFHDLWKSIKYPTWHGSRRGHMVVGFIIACAISSYHHCCEFEPRSWRGVLDTLCDKSSSFTYNRLVIFSTNKTDRHNITKILLKVALNTINQPTWQHQMKYRTWKHRTQHITFINFIFSITGSIFNKGGLKGLFFCPTFYFISYCCTFVMNIFNWST